MILLGVIIGVVLGGLLCMAWVIFEFSKMKW